MKQWDKLCNAVVYQACVDYANSLGKKGKDSERMREDCESFFQSQEFGLYTDIDGKVIMQLIQDGKKRNHHYKYRGL